MLWMPLKSYKGPWVPLVSGETRLRDVLQRDVRTIADEIGERHLFVYPPSGPGGKLDRNLLRGRVIKFASSVTKSAAGSATIWKWKFRVGPRPERDCGHRCALRFRARLSRSER